LYGLLASAASVSGVQPAKSEFPFFRSNTTYVDLSFSTPGTYTVTLSALDLNDLVSDLVVPIKLKPINVVAAGT
jgi:hypothetical protein